MKLDSRARDHRGLVDEEGIEGVEKRRKHSFKDMLLGANRADQVQDCGYEDASDDDVGDEEEEGPWFTMTITTEGKKEARKPWKLNVIIKLVGRTIGYHHLLQRLQAMWRPQQSFRS